MKKYLNLTGAGALFIATALTLFSTLNPAFIPVLICTWLPLEKAIAKFDKKEA